MSDDDIQRMFREGDEHLAVVNQRRAEYEREHGPIKVYPDLGALLQTAPVGDGFRAQVSGQTFVTPIPVKLRFYCDGSDDCRRVLDFSASEPVEASNGFLNINSNSSCFRLLVYSCRYCQAQKSFLLLIQPVENPNACWVCKVGEWPPGGEPLSESLIRMVGKGKSEDLLRKGYDCELQGKGIAAFAYYRRIVEYRTQAVIKKLKEVAQLSNAGPGVIEKLDSALAEPSYKRALELANEVAPGILITGSENPLWTLHKLVSGDLHKGSDAECYENATETRLILQYVCARIESALAEHNAMRMALDKAKQRTQRGGAP